MALKIHADRSATLTCDDGNIVYSKPFELTDFPLAVLVPWHVSHPPDLIQLVPRALGSAWLIRTLEAATCCNPALNSSGKTPERDLAPAAVR